MQPVVRIANKSRLPPLDGSMVTAIVRQAASTNADLASTKPLPLPSVNMVPITTQTSAKSVTQMVGGLRTNQFFATPPPSERSWLIVDDENYVWYGNETMTTILPLKVRLPLAANFWRTDVGKPRYQCTRAGKFWYFHDDINQRILKGTIDFSEWSQLSGITIGNRDVSISEGRSGKIYIVSNVYVNISSDGGSTWVTRTIPNLSFVDIVCFETSSLVLISGTTNGGSSVVLGTTNDFVSYASTTLSNSNRVFALSKIGQNVIATGEGMWLFRGLTTTMGGTVWMDISSYFGVNKTLRKLDGIFHAGTHYVANSMNTGPGIIMGPVWSTSLTLPWTDPIVTGGNGIKTNETTPTRGLRYNGSTFAYRDNIMGQLYKSSDGKVWQYVPHPGTVPPTSLLPGVRREFVAAFPMKDEKNLELRTGLYATRL